MTVTVSGSDGGEEEEEELVCVECGQRVAFVFREYSAGNIRLQQCGGCGRVVDRYVELETVLVVLDLVLHRAQVYRHLLFNRFHAAQKSIASSEPAEADEADRIRQQRTLDRRKRRLLLQLFVVCIAITAQFSWAQSLPESQASVAAACGSSTMATLVRTIQDAPAVTSNLTVSSALAWLTSSPASVLESVELIARVRSWPRCVLTHTVSIGLRLRRSASLALLCVMTLLEWSCFLLGVRLAVFMFTSSTSRRASVVEALVLASFGKLFMLPMLVWPYEEHVRFGVYLFILSSNTVALHVLLNTGRARAALCVLFGLGVQNAALHAAAAAASSLLVA